MKEMRRLDVPASKGLFQRIQRSPLRNLDPRLTSEDDVTGLEKEHPELIVADDKGAMFLKPWQDVLLLVYGFADRDSLQQRFQPLVEKLADGLDTARWPTGVYLRLTDHPNRPFIEPVLTGCAFEPLHEWIEMDLIELPEADPPSPAVAPGYLLRPATEDDLPEYVELDREAFDAPRPMTMRAAQEKLATEDLFQMLVSEADRRLAGFLCLMRWPQATGFIDDVAVRPDLQRRGLGEAMVRWALAWFHEQGMRRARLEVLLDNGSAIALYRKLGFTAGTTGLTYRRPLDQKELRRIRDSQRGTYIKFGTWR